MIGYQSDYDSQIKHFSTIVFVTESETNTYGEFFSCNFTWTWLKSKNNV